MMWKTRTLGGSMAADDGPTTAFDREALSPREAKSRLIESLGILETAMSRFSLTADLEAADMSKVLFAGFSATGAGRVA